MNSNINLKKKKKELFLRFCSVYYEKIAEFFDYFQLSLKQKTEKKKVALKLRQLSVAVLIGNGF